MSAKQKFLDKLNRVLAARDVMILLADDRVGFTSTHTQYVGYNCWSSLENVFFTNDDEYMIFELHEAEDHSITECEQEAMSCGLMHLEGCSSWEELLLKLEIMFPEV